MTTLFTSSPAKRAREHLGLSGKEERVERGGGGGGEGVKKHVLTAVFRRAALLDHVNFMYWSWLYVLLLVYVE